MNENNFQQDLGNLFVVQACAGVLGSSYSRIVLGLTRQAAVVVPGLSRPLRQLGRWLLGFFMVSTYLFYRRFTTRRKLPQNESILQHALIP